MKTLTVISPFEGLETGDRIVDEERIEEILDGENAHRVLVSIVADPEAATPEEE